MDDRFDALDDEVLDVRPRRASRWVIGIAACAVLAAVAGVVVHERGGGHKPAHAAPSGSPVAVTTPSATGVYFAGSTLVTLDHGVLRAVDVRFGGLVGKAGVPPVAAGEQIDLVGDPAGSVLWAVSTNSVQARFSEYRLPGLHLLRRVAWPHVTQSAAALAGHLYLSTSLGVVDLAPAAAAPEPIPGLYGAVGPVVADPARHRIIAIDLGYPTDVWSYRPGRVPVESRSPLPLADGTVGVVGDRIWIGGRQDATAQLWQLAPSSFEPVSKARLPAGFGTRAVVVASGTDVVWMRSAADPFRLYCVGGDRGQVLQSWPVRGAVVSANGAAFVDTRSGVQPLVLDSCRG